jgi:GH24 family phage-related lysozyme (muramidase)
MGIESKVNIRTPWPLSQGQYDALVSFTYNEGAGWLQSSTLTPGWSVNRTLLSSA